MSHHRRILVWGLILLSMAVRFAALQGNLYRLGEDVDGYLELAEWGEFGTGVGGPTAYRPPLYPLMLAPFFWIESHFNLVWGFRLAGIAALHLALGAATVLCTLSIGERLGLAKFARLAACLVAVDPLLVHNARLPMTETPAAFFVSMSLLLIVSSNRDPRSWRTWMSGLLLGLGMLCRTTLWAFAGAGVLVAVAAPGQPARRRISWAGAVLGVALAVQAPWAIRNWFALGKPILTTTHGGYTLLLANNDTFYDEVLHGPWGTVWSNESLTRWQEALATRTQTTTGSEASELGFDWKCYRIARQTIRARPADFMRSVAYRVVSFWRVFPHAAGEHGPVVLLACALFYAPELLLMIVGLWQRRVWQWPLILLPATVLGFQLVHLVYWTDMRMRAPIMPAIAILAAMGTERVIRAARRPISETDGETATGSPPAPSR